RLRAQFADRRLRHDRDRRRPGRAGGARRSRHASARPAGASAADPPPRRPRRPEVAMRIFVLAAGLAAAALSLDGCTLGATPTAPAVPAIESGSGRAPGTYMLDIQSGPLIQEARRVGLAPTGLACLINNYPVDATG